MRSASGIDINDDMDHSANATRDIRKVIEKAPPEITIKLFG